VCPIFTLAYVPPPLRYPPITIRKPPVVSSFASTAVDGGVFPNDERVARVSVSNETAESLEVWIDQELCTGDGICVQYAPEVFELDIDGLAYVKGDDDQLRQALVPPYPFRSRCCGMWRIRPRSALVTVFTYAGPRTAWKCTGRTPGEHFGAPLPGPAGPLLGEHGVSRW